MKKITEWMRTHKRYAGAAVIVIMVLVSVSAAAASGVFSSIDTKEGKAEKGQTESSEPDTTDIPLHITADQNWGEDSTPAIAHISGADDSNASIDFYHAVLPGSEGGQGTSSVSLEVGDYQIEFISPVNADGSVYETNGVQNITVNTETEDTTSVDCSLTQISADQVTDEMLQDIIDQTKEAIENGDETLKGDAGQAVLDKLEGNVANNPNASDATKQDAADADTEVNVYDDPKATVSTDDKDTNSKDTAQSTASDTGKGSSAPSSSTSGNASSSSSGSNSSSSQTSKPAHTHTWKNHTAKRWVSNWVTVVDTPAQTVQGARLYTQNSDGTWTANGETYWFENGFTSADLAAIIKNKIKTEGYIGNYQNVSKSVPAVTHQEDQGHYEEYVDYQYCDCGATR